jgi:RNA polymerase sigma factor (sigma-70 family)
MRVKTARARIIFDYLRKAVTAPGAGPTDGQLLRQYFALQDEAAFTVLVRRHGPMVLAVCRRLLGHAQDSEDAFQATFVILARKGRRVAGQQTIGGWLHGVAYRVALDVRRRGVRRRAKEQQVEIMPQPIVTPKEDLSELLAVLDRELTRLPEKYRLPVVLCELEGRSRKEAARQLGLPEGTLSSRLATARKTLAKRMAGHGAAVTGASLTALFASEAGAVVVPGPLVASTVRAAGGVVSAGVVALAEGVLKAMLLTKIKSAGLVLLLASAVAAGGAGLTYRAAAQTAAEPKPQPAVAEGQTKGHVAPSITTRKPATPEQSDLESLRLEVEALRVSLQATRERVKALEAAAQTQQKPVGADHNRSALPLAIPGSAQGLPVPGLTPPIPSGTPGEAPPKPNFKPAPPAGAVSPAQLPPPGATPLRIEATPTPSLAADEKIRATLILDSFAADAKTTEEAEAKVRDAAALLMHHPTNKQMQEALKKAIEQMNRQAEPKTDAGKP